MLEFMRRLVAAIRWLRTPSVLLTPEGSLMPIVAGGAPDDGGDDGGEGGDDDAGGDDDGSDDDDDAGDDDGSDDDDDEKLGEKGKAALKKERELRKKAQREARAAKAKATKAENALKKQREGKKSTDDADKAVEDARDEARREERAKSARKLFKASVQTAAIGKFTDPKLASRLLDIDDFEPNDDGDYDEEEIEEALDELLEENPSLKIDASAAGKVRGNGDGGVKTSTKDDTKVTPGLGRIRHAYETSSKKRKK